MTVHSIFRAYLAIIVKALLLSEKTCVTPIKNYIPLTFFFVYIGCNEMSNLVQVSIRLSNGTIRKQL